MLRKGSARQPADDAIAASAVAAGHGRERGLWSFLTWAFFLSQLTAANAFAGGGAQVGNGIDLKTAGDSAAGPGGTGSSAPGLGEGRPIGLDEPQAADVASGATSHRFGGESHELRADVAVPVDATGDAGHGALLTVAFNAGAPGDAQPGQGGNDAGTGALPSDPLPDATLGAPLGSDIVPGLITPVVDLVEDLGSALSPVLGNVLSPVGAVVDGLVGGLQPVLDPLLSPVSELVQDVAALAEPVADVTGQVLHIADPVLASVGDAVEHVVGLAEPILAPAVNAIEPIVDIAEPVVDAIAPVVAMADPVVEKILEPLSPIVEPLLQVLPVLEILPLGINGAPQGDGAEAVVTAGGSLEFENSVEASIYELFEAGSYTEYGVALQVPQSGGESGIEIELENVPTQLVTLLDDIDDGVHLPLIGSLQHDTGLRGLADGLL